MKDIALENARIGQHLTVHKTKLTGAYKLTPQAEIKLSRFPPIERVLVDIVQNRQFNRT
jgi:hypothetical protein